MENVSPRSPQYVEDGRVKKRECYASPCPGLTGWGGASGVFARIVDNFTADESECGKLLSVVRLVPCETHLAACYSFNTTSLVQLEKVGVR